MDPQLRHWVLERHRLMSVLLKFKQFVNESMKSTPIRYVQESHKCHDPWFNSFSDVQAKIITSVADYFDLDEDDVVRMRDSEGDRFEDLYFDLLSEVQVYIEGVNSKMQKGIVANPPSGAVATSYSSRQQQIVELPPSKAYLKEVIFKNFQDSVVYQRDPPSDLDRRVNSLVTSLLSGSQANQNLSGVQKINPHMLSDDHRDALKDIPPPGVANFHNLRSTKQDETRVVQPLVNPHRNATSSTYDTSQTSQSFQYQDINP